VTRSQRKRFMVVAIGTAGDVFPFIGLGRALAQRGHEVHLLSLDRYQSFAESAGLVFHAIKGVTGAAGDPDFYHPTKSMQLIARRALLPSIRPVYKFVSELDPSEWSFISDSVSYGVRISQEQRGFRLTTCIVSPFMVRSVERMPVTPGVSVPAWAPAPIKRAFFRFVSRLWDRELAPELNRFRRELGLEPVSDILYSWSVSTDRVIGLFPEWFAPRAPDWPEHFVHGEFTAWDQAVAGEIPDSLRASGTPLVLFCAGSAGAAAHAFFMDAVTASRGREWRAVLLAPGWEPPASLPANVIRCGYIPLSLMLESAGAVVHHGGLGAMSAALAAGVPQVVVPFGHDQLDNAARVGRLGVARAVRSGSGRAAAIASSIQELLGDSRVRDRCLEVRKQAAREENLIRLCERIEAEHGLISPP
jgi:UDP:flavonoid glycosyltransferase YjiC (YdhE family)